MPDNFGSTEKNLINFYNHSYSIGEEKVFTFLAEELLAEEIKFVLQHYDFSQRTTLEVGCGSGRLAAEIAEVSQVEYLGIDFSETAIGICNTKNLGDRFKFQCLNVFDLDDLQRFDYVVALGVLEHTVDPLATLKKLKSLLNDGGKIILAVPHFLNPRGVIWMTLATLLRVPMSLSDRHFIHPWDMSSWAEEIGMKCHQLTTVDREWAFGNRLLKDFRKRIPNALGDAGYLNDISAEDFFDYLQNLVNHVSTGNNGGPMLEGATALYELTVQM
jgi:2-polyprenyl-3-methyl-5-hydroxy-6-metoxy-1,4-benzoquinol methylase